MRRPSRGGPGSRPTVLDAMTVLVVTAVGLWIGARSLALRYGTGNPGDWKAIEVLARWALLAIAAFLSVPLIGRRARTHRRLGHHAGTAVVVANLLGVVFAATFYLPRVVDHLRPGGLAGNRGVIGLSLIGITDPSLIAPAVAASWVAVIVLDRPRWSFDWLDRLGRLVGAGWIVLFVVRVLLRIAD